MKRITIKQSLANSLKPAYYLLGGLIAAASISGALLVSSRVSADNDTVVDDVSIEVPVSCSMSGNVTTAHSATLANGTYSGGTTEHADGIGSATLSVSCNDPGGFSIYTVGFTGDKEGDNTLKGTNTGLTIPTGVYSQGDTTSKWSMKITKGVDSGDTTNHPLTIDNNFNNYHTVPSKSDGYQRIAHKDAATDMSATPGASVTTTYDAYIDTTQAADTYTSQVKYVMVHPYSSTDDNKPTIVTYMQDVDQIKAELANAAVGTELEVVDSRDNKTYTVAKMADGNIWMNQNLDFDIDSTKTYTPADTDIPANWTPSTSTTTSTTWGTDSSYENLPQSYDPGDLCWKGTPSNDDSGTLGTETVDCSTAGSNKHYHVGNYYNWTAAVAMNDSSSYTTEYQDVDQSICPAGWMLPKGGYQQTGSGSFSKLITDQNLTAGETWNIHTSPAYFVYGGGWYGSSYEVSDFGYYWSSVIYSSYCAYYLSLGAGGYLDHQYDNGRTNGQSVRCVTR